MRARASALGAAAALVLAAPAIAQAPALPVGNFGGGNVLAPPHDPQGKGGAVIGLRAADGKLQIEATVRGSCGGGTFPARTKLAADGSFVASGTSRRRPQSGVRLKTTYRITGTLTAAGVDDGRARATTEIRVSGQKKTLRCKSGTVAFKARRPDGQLGTRGAAPSARYYGFTTQRRDGAHRGLVMRVSKDGSSLTRALYAATLDCGKHGTIPDIIDTPRRSLAISSTGKVSDRVKTTFRDKTTITRSDERFAGSLGSLGATGTLSITERTTSRKTGKRVKTCRTGRLKWTTAP